VEFKKSSLFFFKATLWHKSLPEAAPLPHSPPVRQSDAEMIDRQGPEVGESQEQPWEKTATSGEMFFRGKIRQKCRKIFRDFFHVCSWAGELSKLFQSGLPLSRVPSLQPYFDIVKKMRNFFPIVILFLSILYIEQFVK
jgi:hypothetical protein